MRISAARWSLAAALLAGLSPAIAQTFTSCNPLDTSTSPIPELAEKKFANSSPACPPDPALGTSLTIDFTQGSSNKFTAQGDLTYDSNGVGFTVAKSGDSPTIASKFYIMFGHVEYTIKAAPGQGIVSSAVLQSDDLDEIDWEWIGGDDTQVQTNYFGKGITGSFNRGTFNPDPGNHDAFHTYTVDWTDEQVVWQLDGTTVRVLTQANAEPNQYPQTPMQIKVGCWSGGDPSNPPGTISKSAIIQPCGNQR
jgi:beta-glucanase (GH16 family)